MSIEDIELEHFIALPQTEINSSTKSCPLHAVFRYFLSGDSKQDTTTTNAHSKCFIGLFKIHILESSLITILENTDGLQNNIYVTQHYTLCQLCPNVTHL